MEGNKCLFNDALNTFTVVQHQTCAKRPLKVKGEPLPTRGYFFLISSKGVFLYAPSPWSTDWNEK